MTVSIWLNPNDPASVTESAGRVTNVANQVDINANDVQENASSGPPTGAAINGKTVLDFSDRLDYLETSGNYSFSGPDLSVIVAYVDDGGIAGTDDESICGASNGATVGWALKKEFANSPIRFDIQASGGLQVTGGLSAGPIDIICGRYDSVRDFAEMWKNSNDEYASADKAVTLSVAHQFEIGNDGSGVRGWGSGEIAEVIVFDGVMRYDQMQRVEGYLAHKYVSPASDYLPLGHPFRDQAPDILLDADFLATFEGADGATSYTAETGGAATFVGNAQLDDNLARQGFSSLLLDGTGDYVTFPDAANYDFAGDDFTVEGWFRFDTVGALDDHALVSHWDANGVNQRSWVCRRYVSGTDDWFIYSTTGTNTIQATGYTFNPVANTWYHLAWVRSGADLYFFIDGIKVATHNIGSSVLFSNAEPLMLGATSESTGIAREMDGNIDSVRIIKGKALYTGDFDVPHRSFKVPEPATLIANFNGPDAATSYTSEDAGARTATFTNQAAIDTAQHKWGHSSAVFDGTDDFVSFPDSADWEIGTGDFSAECWVRFNGDPGTGTDFIMGHYTVTGDERGWLIDLNNNSLRFGWTTDGLGGTFASITGTWNPADATWYHIEVERYQGVLYMYVDGACIATAAFTATPHAAASTMNIGGCTGGNSINGWIDGVRFTKGHALRHKIRPIDAPNTPFGEIKTLTIDFEGADAETSYEAEDGRTVTFGAGSALDDAERARGSTSLFTNDDGVNVPSNTADLQIGSSDFGFECWIRSTVASTDKVFWDQRTTTTQVAPAAYVKSNNQFAYYVNGADVIAGGTFAANTWYHVVIQRIQGVTRMYVDGTLIGSWTDSSNYLDATMYIGTRFNLVTGWNGWIDHVRFDPNNALYGGDFDVPVNGPGEPIV